MAVKLELYRIFRTVAEEESISAAAKTLFISQSAVSQSIHQLEEQLQVRLFSRQPRGVTLTGEGRVLYDYVRSAISLIETGEEKVQQTRELMMGELVIGASDTVTRSLLLPYLQRFHERYPAIRLKVLNGTSYEALQMLRAGQVDLAFAMEALSNTAGVEEEDILLAAYGRASQTTPARPTGPIPWRSFPASR